MNKRKIILASTSPRRREILEKLGLEFEIISSDYDEILDNDEFSYSKIEDFAYNKAKSVYEKISEDINYKKSLIISADTVVVLENKILMKPESEYSAFEMLAKLSGNSHSVVTSTCLFDVETGNNRILSATSFVYFNDLSNQLILDYVNKFKPLDKAGAYGIQELPEGFVKQVEGSFENIVGLCSEVVKELLNVEFN